MNSTLLDGLKVADFSALLPGPFGTVLLADLGADVVKIEPPGGDLLRHFPFGMVSVANRNKRSMVVDLKNPASREVVDQLAGWADVVLEGSRPGIAERIGIGADRLRAVNPKLVYCSLSGFGQTGPWRDRAGHDITYMAAAGALAYPGSADETRVRRSGLPVSDLSGSLYAAVAILSAYIRAQRTGQGATIDLSLTEAAMSFMSVRGDLGNEQINTAYLLPGNDTFVCGDGRWMALGLIEQPFWEHFVEAAADLEPELRQPRYATLQQRLNRSAEVADLVGRAMRGRSSDQWEEIFERLDVPSQVVLTPFEAVATEQSRARGLIRRKDGETHLPFPMLVDGDAAGVLRSLLPKLGENTRDVLSDIGFGDADVQRLMGTGAFDARRPA